MLLTCHVKLNRKVDILLFVTQVSDNTEVLNASWPTLLYVIKDSTSPYVKSID